MFITICLYFIGILFVVGIPYVIYQSIREASDKAALSRPRSGAIRPNAAGRTPAAAAAPSQPARVRAESGQDRKALLRSAVLELRDIGVADSLYLNGRWNPRVREIGELLDESGGMPLMRAAHEAFSAALPKHSRELDVAWDKIGGWLG